MRISVENKVNLELACCHVEPSFSEKQSQDIMGWKTLWSRNFWGIENNENIKLRGFQMGERYNFRKVLTPVLNPVDSMLGASWSSWNWVSDFLLIATSELRKVAAIFGWRSQQWVLLSWNPIIGFSLVV